MVTMKIHTTDTNKQTKEKLVRAIEDDLLKLISHYI